MDTGILEKSSQADKISPTQNAPQATVTNGSLICVIVFTGKEPNKALGLSSLKREDCVPEYDDLDETATKTLNDWYTFFSKRYNIVGKVVR